MKRDLIKYSNQAEDNPLRSSCVERERDKSDAKKTRTEGQLFEKVASELTTTTNKSEEFVRGNKNEPEDE